jgi:hypothetical protein
VGSVSAHVSNIVPRSQLARVKVGASDGRVATRRRVRKTIRKDANEDAGILVDDDIRHMAPVLESRAGRV